MSFIFDFILRKKKKDHGTAKPVITVDEPLFEHINVQDWISNEEPYQHMGDQDKRVLPSIGISINKVVRMGNEDNGTRIFDRIIRDNTLKENLIVYRGVTNQDYESRLAQKYNLGSNYLYYDGYIFCSLNAGPYFWDRKTKMIISVPSGSHYLFTGEYSNAPESDEIILDRNSVLEIKKEEDIGDKHYIWAELVGTL